MRAHPHRIAAISAALVLVAGACGSDDESPDSAAASPDQPTIVVTTNVLGDVVEEIVGDQANVITIMPVGADPHDFQASAQDVDRMVSADALIVNGADFEEGLLDVIENAVDDGVPTHEAISTVDTIEFGEGGHDHDDHEDDGDESHEDHDDETHEDHDHDEGHDHDESHEDHDHDEGHDDEDHKDDETHEDHDHDESHEDHDETHEDHKDGEDGDHDHGGHDHSGADPHFFTDPIRMVAAVEGIVDFLTAEIGAINAEQLDEAAADYIDELEEIDSDSAAMFDDIPDENRVLVTNHEVFGYFADRYEFEVVGAVIPGGSTTDSVSAAELAELAEVIEDEGVPAIFSDTSSSDELIDVLADEVGDIEVVELYTESLGEEGSDGETYLGMLTANAERITEALG